MSGRPAQCRARCFGVRTQARLPEIPQLQQQLAAKVAACTELEAKAQQDAENAAFAQAELEAAKQEMQQSAAELEGKLGGATKQLEEAEAARGIPAEQQAAGGADGVCAAD